VTKRKLSTSRKTASLNTAHKEGPAGRTKSVLLTKEVSQQLVVMRCCSHALQAGVRHLMPLTLAEALSPGAYSEPFDPVRDCRALYRLAVWFLQYSPLVGLDYELFRARSLSIAALSEVSHLHYGIIADLTGTEKLHRDLREFSTFIQKTFAHSARVALAPTLGAAWALSRYGHAKSLPLTVPSQSHISEALSDLPVHALRIDSSCISMLGDVGIQSIGALLQLPRRSLAQRFGKFLLYRLDQALGTIEERLHTVTPPRHFESAKVFEPPLINRASITRAIEHLFNALLETLQREERIAKTFSLTISDTTAQSITKEFPLAAATSDTKHLAAIITPIIETMTFFGEVREIKLKAKQIEAAYSDQITLGASRDSAHSKRERKELLNSFSVRLGKDRVSLATLHHSYIPERSFSYTSAISSSSYESTPVTSHTVCEPLVPYTITDRPSILLENPEQISTIAMLPDKPPSFINWRGAHLKIISGIGPERIAPEWWASDLQTGIFSERDYFKIQDDCGRWLWVYRNQGTHEWFLHGVWT
jgi:protein ImuB